MNNTIQLANSQKVEINMLFQHKPQNEVYTFYAIVGMLIGLTNLILLLISKSGGGRKKNNDKNAN